ncbi:MAG: hypothetical protein ACRD3B_06400 [Candidatus Sulfotelmatobacter sp.]
MSTSPLRAAMVPVSRQMRAYFAPVNRETETPTIFDPGLAGMFPLDAPPAPWVDLGWIENFARWYDTPTDGLRSGVKSLPTAQFRGPLEARVEFDFRQWGKLQMALAGGSEHMNVLALAAGSASPAPSGGTPAPAVAVLPGSTASVLVLGSGAASAFPDGSLIAVDLDYQQQIGYVGSGIAAAFVSDPLAVRQDPNYARRVTFNVGRVAEATATSVVLRQPLLGGAPGAGASAQMVVAFVDREGGSFFQAWSALFVAEDESGGRVCFYYPRLSPGAMGAGKLARDGFAEIVKPVAAVSLHAAFLALPFFDTNDGQSVLCYRSYFPAGMAGVY